MLQKQKSCKTTKTQREDVPSTASQFFYFNTDIFYIFLIGGIMKVVKSNMSNVKSQKIKLKLWI